MVVHHFELEKLHVLFKPSNFTQFARSKFLSAVLL